MYGRNDPCPCKSGKKYKKCCGESGIWKFFRENGGYNLYAEHYVLEKVLLDPHFKSYYLTERAKISTPLFFLQATGNLVASATYGSIGEAYYIATSHSQIPTEDSIHVAHELGHLVLHSAGHMVVYLMNEDEGSRAHEHINDMIYDPLVNRGLIANGFDLSSYFNQADKGQTISTHKSYDNIFMAKTLYVKKILDHRNLFPLITAKEISYNKWVEQHYPSCRGRGRAFTNH